jgi:hypothetical protein
MFAQAYMGDRDGRSPFNAFVHFYPLMWPTQAELEWATQKTTFFRRDEVLIN